MGKGKFKGEKDGRSRFRRETESVRPVPRDRTKRERDTNQVVQRVDQDAIPKEENRYCDPEVTVTSGQHGCGWTGPHQALHYRDGTHYTCMRCLIETFVPAKGQRNYIPWR